MPSTISCAIRLRLLAIAASSSKIFGLVCRQRQPLSFPAAPD
jgi:hypothetical protein